MERSGSEKIAWVCLHALVIAVPLAMSNLTILSPVPQAHLTNDQFDIVKVFVLYATVLAGLAAWAVSMLTRGGKVRLTRILWLMLAFLGWAAISTATSVHWPTALFGAYQRYEGLLSLASYVALFFLALQLADRPGRIRSLARTLAVVGGAVAAYGVLQHFGVDPVRWGPEVFEARRSFATYGNPGFLAGFLLFPMPVALAMALSEQDRRMKVAYWVCFLLVVVCLLTTFVRGAWVAGLVVLVVMGVALVRARVRAQALDWAFAGAALLAGLAVIVKSLASLTGATNVLARLASAVRLSEGSAGHRLELWAAAMKATTDRPVFGFGPDTFRLFFPRFKPEDYARTHGFASVADTVHDYPLQLSSTVGVPGLLMMCGLFVWVLVVSAPPAFAKGKGSERLVLAGFWAAVAGYLTHLVFGLSLPGTTAFLWLSMALLVSPIAVSRELRAPTWGRVGAIAAVAVAALAIVLAATPLLADHEYVLGRIAGISPVRAQHYRSAVSLSPSGMLYRRELGSAYLDLMAASARDAATAKQAGQDPRAALARADAYFRSSERTLKDAIAFCPSEFSNYVVLTMLYNQAGTYLNPAYRNAAIQAGEEGVAVDPFGPMVHYQLGIALVDSGQLAAAAAEARRAMALDPAYADPKLLLGYTLIAQGRLKEARTVYVDLLRLQETPENSFIMQEARARLSAVEASLSPAGR